MPQTGNNQDIFPNLYQFFSFWGQISNKMAYFLLHYTLLYYSILDFYYETTDFSLSQNPKIKVDKPSDSSQKQVEWLSYIAISSKMPKTSRRCIEF